MPDSTHSLLLIANVPAFELACFEPISLYGLITGIMAKIIPSILMILGNNDVEKIQSDRAR